MDFAQTVKQIRQELNISQEQLARHLQVSFASVNRWENGKNCPNMLTKKVLYEFCKDKELNEEVLKSIIAD